jgi:hypothetical protein
VIGRRYRWRDEVWTVRCRWAGAGPRNVLIENGEGELVVRPFRGLRRER